KIVDADGDDPGQATTETYVYGQGIGGQQSQAMLFSRSGTSGSVDHRYLNGPQADQVIADNPILPSGGALNWLLTDQQSSVRRVIAGDGSTVANLDYDSYGKITSALKPSDIDLLFGYTGQVYDRETGLDFYEARYYDSSTGRFISTDSLEFAGGYNNLY